MKNKKTVGLFGKLHGLTRKLSLDLPELGFVPFEIDAGDLAHPPGTVAVICAIAGSHPAKNQRAPKELQSLSHLIESLRDDQIHLIFVSMAANNHPQKPLLSLGHLDLSAETLIRESGIPYTIVRTMSAEDRPGHHHKIFWKQDFEGDQKGHQHPVPWEDLAQVLVHCVNRSQALSKTFTVHAVAGEPPVESLKKAANQFGDSWDHWFQGLSADVPGKSSTKKSA